MKRNNLILLFLFLSTHVAVSQLSLDSCLHLALQHNAVIQQAHLDVEKSKTVKQQAFTKYFPQISATGLGYHALHPMIELSIDDISNSSIQDLLLTLYGNYGAALGLQNTFSLFHHGYSASVTAIQPIYAGGKIVTGNRLAQIGVEASQLQATITQRNLLEQVEESYWLVINLTDKKRTTQIAQSTLDTLYTAVQSAVEAGLALSSDLLQVELKQDELRRKTLQLNNGLLLARQALCQSIGINHTDSLQLIKSDTQCILPPLQNDTSVITPEEELLALQVKAAQLQRRMILADGLPQIAVGANYGYSHFQANLLRNGLGNKTGNGAVFVSVNLPLSQWWETRHKLKEHTLNIKKTELEQKHLCELLCLRTQQVLYSLQQAYLYQQETHKAIQKATEHLRLTQLNYEAGRSTLSELLAAQTAVFEAENQHTDAVNEYHIYQRRYNNLVNPNSYTR